MRELYGEYAETLNDNLQELDKDFSEIIKNVPYEQFWTREGLSLRDKSLCTVAALIALGKEEQTGIHMKGFLHSGGKVDDLKNMIIHLSIYCGFPASLNAFSTLNKVVSSTKNSP